MRAMKRDSFFEGRQKKKLSLERRHATLVRQFAFNAAGRRRRPVGSPDRSFALIQRLAAR
jgi:hypothetical protein